MRRPASRAVPPRAAVLLVPLVLGLPAAAQERALRPIRMIAAPAPAAAAQAPALLQAGAVAPDFAALGVDGREIRLADQRGKVVVLDFWATWCGPCLQSLPHLQDIARQQKENGVVVFAVCTSDTRARFDAWIGEHAAEYPDLVFASDPHERGSASFDERAAHRLYHVSGLPTKFVVGRDGKIALTMVGSSEGDRRLEAGLARAGVPIDAALAAEGEAQAEASAKAAAARAANARPAPMFFPEFGALRARSPLPDFALAGADGRMIDAAGLRGRPFVLVLSWPDIAPRRELDAMARKYAGYGLQVVSALVTTAREDFAGWVREHGAGLGYRVGWDPAGKFVAADGEPDPDARQAFHRTTLIGRLFAGGMYPALPVALLADAEGRFVGGFRLGAEWDDAVGNLLLHLGVELRPDDMPRERAPAEAFAPAPPRAAEPAVEPIAVGAMAPDFTTQDLEGAPVRLSDYRGKVVVLDFWATWCGPCKAAMPHVQQIAAGYRDQGVVVLASCTSDGREAFEQWVRERRAEYPDIVFAHDAAERGPERASRALYGVSGIPAQFVIDREGRIVAAVSGYMPGEVLLDAALAKAGIAVDAAILEKAAEDQAARDARSRDRKTTPALPLAPVRR